MNLVMGEINLIRRKFYEESAKRGYVKQFLVGALVRNWHYQIDRCAVAWLTVSADVVIAHQLVY